MIAKSTRGQLNRKPYILCPRLRLRIWSREIGSAVVPSRVILLILYTQAESGAYPGNFSRFSRRRLFIYIVNRHRVSPEFIRPRNCIPMVFPAERPPAQGQ